MKGDNILIILVIFEDLCFRCGGGKTAVFIAIDYCLKQLQSDASVDIYSTVLHLRKFRKNMVRSLVSIMLVIFIMKKSYLPR